jgi:hypothetical protein
MALSIKPKFTKQQLNALVGQKLSRFNDAVVLRFIRIGENFVNDARTNHTYTDRTGNLTSSIGYIILKDGVQLVENFLDKPGPELNELPEAQKKALSGFTGKTAEILKADLQKKLVGKDLAKKVAEDLAAKYSTGYVLICVAGMDYAASVESKGYDVITSSAITAKDELPKQLNNLISKTA